MATSLAIPNPEELSLKKYIGRSVVLHALVFGAVLGASYFGRSVAWGGVGGQMAGTKVTLVSAPAAGIPMPKEPVVTASKAVDPTKSLYKEEPKPKVPEPKTDATKIPKFDKEKPLPPSKPSRTLENKTPIPDNAIPKGQGGAPDLPTGYAQTPGGGGAAGVTTPGQGSADFATRYGWYIDAAERRVYPNWNMLLIDPAVRNSTTMHCVISFRILRDGSIRDLRIAQSSGNSSWDNSGLRAIQSSIPFAPLPTDWNAQDVFVLWDFPEKHN